MMKFARSSSLRMVVELADGVAHQRDVILSRISTIPHALLLVVLLLLSILALFKRRFLYSTFSSVPTVAWLLSKGENNEHEKTHDKRPAEKQVKDPRHFLDTAEARRLSRDLFYRDYKAFDHNSTPQNDKEKGINVTESIERNSRGLEIFVKSWVPAEAQPHGLIFICHGYGDTITYFTEGVARAFVVAGYAVYGMDYPGFGLSEGLHGYVPNFDRLVDDVIERYSSIKGRPEFRGMPYFLFGESMGGAVALKAHLKDPSMWDGAILVAPMCKIAESVYPPWYLLQIMIALAHVIPKAKLVPRTDIAAIGARNEEKRKIANSNPVAYVGNPRLGTALSMLRTTDEIGSKLHKVSLPLLVLHGASDQVTDPAISKLLHEKAKSPDKTLRLYEGAWHCLLQGEPDDVVTLVMKDIISWLDARAASKAELKQMSEKVLEERVASAIPNLINFGRFNEDK